MSRLFSSGSGPFVPVLIATTGYYLLSALHFQLCIFYPVRVSLIIDKEGVRRVFHELRTMAIENFNERPVPWLFDGHASVPTKGLANTSRWALGSVFVYQLALLYRYEHQQPLRIGLKPFLKAA